MNNKVKTSVIAAGALLVWLVAGSTQHCLAQATSSPLAPPPQAAVDDHASSTGASASPETNAAPLRESWTTIDLGTKYVKGVFGGLEQGASMGFGVQFTTADKMKGVELKATLLTSAKLYRRFEVEAYFPKLFSENTHADVWFDYLRRTKDNFFGIGPRIPNTS